MTKTLDASIATLLIAAGLVLAVGFPDAELLWFRGRPLGVVLTVIGVLDLGWALLGRRYTDS